MVSRRDSINTDNRLPGVCKKKDCIKNIDVADTPATPLYRKQRRIIAIDTV